MKKLPQILYEIVIVSVLARIASAWIMGDSVVDLPGIYDQISYNTLATRIIGGHGFTFAQQWWPITPAGQPTAHWSYLYTLYLVAVYALFGVHPLVARMLQAVVAGILTPLLVYRLAGRVFAPRLSAPAAQAIALLAAAWTAVYGYFAYYGGALMTEPFYILGLLWIFDVAICIADSSSVPTLHCLELGLAIALTAMLRQVFLPFVPFLFLWLLWQRLGREKFAPAVWNIAQGGAVVAVVCMLLIGPITLFNYQQFGRFILLNTNSGYAFFWANHPIYGDRFEPILDPAHGVSYQDLIPPELRQLDEAALDQALLRHGLGFIAQDPSRYLRLSLSRIPAYFEFWPSTDSGLLSNIVRVVSFGLALPFMLLGIFFWLRDYRGETLASGSRSPGALVLLFIIIYSSIHLLSWALIRYRLPLDAVGLMFAARGAYSVLERTSHQWLAPFRRDFVRIKS